MNTKIITIKYMSHEPLPQLVYDNLTKLGESKIDGYPMYKIDFNGKLSRVYDYLNKYDTKNFQRNLKLKRLLGIEWLNEMCDFEIAFAEFWINESIKFQLISTLEDNLAFFN